VSVSQKMHACQYTHWWGICATASQTYSPKRLHVLAWARHMQTLDSQITRDNSGRQIWPTDPEVQLHKAGQEKYTNTYRRTAGTAVAVE
jgi:hypothetical protein